MRTSLKAVLVIALVSGCAEEGPTNEPALEMGAPVVAVVSARPNAVPARYIATPNGWFDPVCVVEVAADEFVTVDGRVVAADGAQRRPAQQCASPRFDLQGVEVDERMQTTGPTVNGWIESARSTALGALSYVHSSWTVPAAPANTGQTIYLFPGLENATLVRSILQPVLGWNHAGGPTGAWSMSSWNCCVNGMVFHSGYISATPGTTVSGDMQGTGCNLTTGVCPTWSIVSRNAAGAVVTLNTTVSQAQNWLFGHVLEAYSIDTCSELPASTSSTASGFVLRNVAGVSLSPPAWGHRIEMVGPQCSYGVAHSSSTVTLSWSSSNACATHQTRPCCPFPNGCVCLGEQACSAGGTWGVCDGAGPAGGSCP